MSLSLRAPVSCIFASLNHFCAVNLACGGEVQSSERPGPSHRLLGMVGVGTELDLLGREWKHAALLLCDSKLRFSRVFASHTAVISSRRRFLTGAAKKV